jgi:hypothetical protein
VSDRSGQRTPPSLISLMRFADQFGLDGLKVDLLHPRHRLVGRESAILFEHAASRSA